MQPKQKPLHVNNDIDEIYLDICQTYTFAHYRSLGSSMVRASHQSSESCRFDPCLEPRNHFSEDRA